MPNLYESDGILTLPQALHKAVDAVSRYPKYRIHTPVDHSIDKRLSRIC